MHLPGIRANMHSLAMLSIAMNRLPVKSQDDQRTADLLHSGAIRLLRRLRLSDAEAGLTGAQSSAISVLIYRGPQTVSGLASAEQVRVPTMSRLVKDLLAAGLATRAAHETDARSAVIDVSEKARRMFATARHLRLSRLEAAIAACTAAEKATLRQAAELLLLVAERID